MDLARITGFDWDEINATKSVDKHQVSQAEAEQVFFNKPLVVLWMSNTVKMSRAGTALVKLIEGAFCTLLLPCVLKIPESA